MKTISIRFPEHLYKEIKQLALQQDRSINRQVIRIVDQYFGIVKEKAESENNENNSIATPVS